MLQASNSSTGIDLNAVKEIALQQHFKSSCRKVENHLLLKLSPCLVAFRPHPKLSFVLGICETVAIETF